MHPEAMAWVAKHADPEAKRVLDLGGRDINGSPRDLFPGADVYRTLDILPGADITADAATWEPDGEYDVALACEVFEHAVNWRAICATAFAALAPGGLFIATMAGPGRPVHSGVDGGPHLHPGEHYENVHPRDLHEALIAAGFVDVVTDRQSQPCDARCTARRPSLATGGLVKGEPFIVGESGPEPFRRPPGGFVARMTADVRADAELPDRELTPEERAHLGITPEEQK